MSDRGVSVALDYIIMLMIATVMLAGIVAVSGTLIDSQVDSGIENELAATGESLAADIQDTERLYNSSADGDPHVRLTAELPDRVGGVTYAISYNESTGELQLWTTSPEKHVTVPVAADRLIIPETIHSNRDIVIESTGEGDLEVSGR